MKDGKTNPNLKSPFEWSTPAQPPIPFLYTDHVGTMLNEYSVFMLCFHTIPNVIYEANIRCKKANAWFKESYGAEIKDFRYTKRFLRNSKKLKYDDLRYVLFEDLLVVFDTNTSRVKLLFQKTDEAVVNKLVEELQQFKKKKFKNKPEMSLLVNDVTGIDTKTVSLSKQKISIDDNYNDDFKEVHEIIMNRLRRKNDRGLVLLHGKPGTGKTSYIRYLATAIKKDIIFLPPNMASSITNPNLISILLDNPNAIFVIEDAENIIVDREKDEASPVSALLNITDGLIADCLNIHVVCSFNTDLSKIDSALTRKGRLVAKYEFKELTVEKAQKLSDSLGFKTVIQEPMTLTAIYNQNDKDFEDKPKTRSIGFQKGG
ncbi:MAG: AAA family ATPase [Schleiferiaceae bacterium]|nr:AAA family ATPase [Schleiferiaceae bacterium]